MIIQIAPESESGSLFEALRAYHGDNLPMGPSPLREVIKGHDKFKNQYKKIDLQNKISRKSNNRLYLLDIGHGAHNLHFQICISDYFFKHFYYVFCKIKGSYSDEDYFQAEKDNISLLKTRLFNFGNLKIVIPDSEKPEVSMAIFIKVAYSQAADRFNDPKQKLGVCVKNCPACKKLFVARRSDTIYCDDCRHKAPLKEYRARNNPRPGERECPYCHKMFTPQRKTGVFCSDKCRVYDKRKKVISAF